MPCLALASRRSPATERVFGEQRRARLPTAADVPAVSVPALEQQQQQPLWQRLAKKTLSAMAVGVLALTLVRATGRCLTSLPPSSARGAPSSPLVPRCMLSFSSRVRTCADAYRVSCRRSDR